MFGFLSKLDRNIIKILIEFMFYLLHYITDYILEIINRFIVCYFI